MFTNFHWDEANLFTRWPDSKVFFANFFQHVKKITQLLEFCKYQGGKIIWVFEKPAYLIHGCSLDKRIEKNEKKNFAVAFCLKYTLVDLKKTHSKNFFFDPLIM